MYLQLRHAAETDTACEHTTINSAITPTSTIKIHLKLTSLQLKNRIKSSKHLPHPFKVKKSRVEHSSQDKQKEAYELSVPARMSQQTTDCSIGPLNRL